MNKKSTDKWKKFTKSPMYVLSESSLSRCWLWIQDHDTAIISAYRNDPLDPSLCLKQQERKEEKNTTLQTNKERSHDLKAAMLYNRYGVTKTCGAYIENWADPENRMEVKEDSYFVTNLNDEGSFFETMETLGQLFCQDSVLMIPKEGKGAYLLGTNKSDWPGLGNRFEVGKFRAGEEAEFMTKVKKRPFEFRESLETFADQSNNAKWIISLRAKKLLG